MKLRMLAAIGALLLGCNQDKLGPLVTALRAQVPPGCAVDNSVRPAVVVFCRDADDAEQTKQLLTAQCAAWTAATNGSPSITVRWLTGSGRMQPGSCVFM